MIYIIIIDCVNILVLIYLFIYLFIFFFWYASLNLLPILPIKRNKVKSKTNDCYLLLKNKK